MILKIREIHENDPGIISEAFKEQGWNKPIKQFERYISEQSAGERVTLVAEIDGNFVGYVNVIWKSYYPLFIEQNIPEINDFNVLIKYRKLGIGSILMDKAEEIISQRSSTAGIGVGVFSDYGIAQVLYVKRGYVPDGKGIHNGQRYLNYGDGVVIDDDIVLYFTKKLRD
jgi:GNAT superfamily N-acetyltransferase